MDIIQSCSLPSPVIPCSHLSSPIICSHPQPSPGTTWGWWRWHRDDIPSPMSSPCHPHFFSQETSRESIQNFSFHLKSKDVYNSPANNSKGQHVFYQYMFWPKENQNIDTAQFLTNTSQLHYACSFVVVDFYTALEKLFSILSRNVLLLRIATILVFFSEIRVCLRNGVQCDWVV